MENTVQMERESLLALEDDVGDFADRFTDAVDVVTRIREHAESDVDDLCLAMAVIAGIDDALKAALDRLDEVKGDLEGELLGRFAEKGVDKLTTHGRTIFPKRTVRAGYYSVPGSDLASKSASAEAKAALVAALQGEPAFADLVKLGFDHNSLSARVKEALPVNPETKMPEIPDDMPELKKTLRIYADRSIGATLAGGRSRRKRRSHE